jgi:hypothetical protein
MHSFLVKSYMGHLKKKYYKTLKKNRSERTGLFCGNATDFHS